MPPVNDNFASATVLSGMSGSVTFSNVGATTETGEPANAEGHSVWFKWTPTSSGTVTVSTQATPLPDWDSFIDVYTGTSFSDLIDVTFDDDGALQPGHTDPFGTSAATWTAAAGTTYWIQVTAYDDVSGPVERSDLVLTWGAYTPPPPAPTLSTPAPTSGVAGTTVTLTGTDLTAVTSVTFGTTAATFTVDSDTQITTAIPSTTTGSSTVTVTSPGGSASSTFTILFYGPWIQPGDTVGTWDRFARGQYAHYDYDATDPYAGAAAAATLDGGPAIWGIENPNVSSDVPMIQVGATVIAVDPQWMIDNSPTDIMPPVPPATPDPTAWFSTPEYEASYGTATGPVSMTGEAVLQSSQFWSNNVPDSAHGVGDPALIVTDLEPFRVYTLPASLYDWEASGSDRLPVLTRWVEPEDITGSVLYEEPPSDGTGMVKADPAVGPQQFWHGGNAGDVASLIDVNISTTLAGLDANGSIALILMPELYMERYNPGALDTIPTGLDPPPYLQSWWAEETTPGDFRVTMHVHYRPPRYRYLYTTPQVAVLEVWAHAEGTPVPGAEIWG